MFKDLYKQANDKIDTLDAKARVMAKLSVAPVVLRKKRPVARFAVLAACFVLTVAAAGIYENMQKDINPALEIPPVAIEEPVLEENVPAVAETKVLHKPQKSTGNTTEAPLKKTDAQPQKTEEITVEPAVLAEEPEQEEASVALLMENEGEPSALALGDAVCVSPEEYCEYIGKNIPEIAALPDGVEDRTEAQWLLTDTKSYTADIFAFVFEGDQTKIVIETTKQHQEAGDEAEVYMSGDILTAQFVADGVEYTITATNCSEGDFENLIHSLK